jgi:hypothetical protein
VLAGFGGLRMSPHDEKKPHPTLAALQWIERHTGDAEAAVNDYQAFENANVLGARIGRAAWLTEAVAMNLAQNTIGRRKAVEMMRTLHQMLFELGRDLEPAFPSQQVERERWNNAANGLAPWAPAGDWGENQRYSNKPKKGAE